MAHEERSDERDISLIKPPQEFFKIVRMPFARFAPQGYAVTGFILYTGGSE